MFSPVIQEFAYSVPLDNALLVADVKSRRPVDQTEILSLASQAQSLFIVATIESRSLERVSDCRRLWTEAARLFGDLSDSWADVASDDPSIAWLRGRVLHYQTLCEDRCSIYRVTVGERRAHAKCKEAEAMSDSELQLTAAPPLDYGDRAAVSVARAMERRIG